MTAIPLPSRNPLRSASLCLLLLSWIGPHLVAEAEGLPPSMTDRLISQGTLSRDKSTLISLEEEDFDERDFESLRRESPGSLRSLTIQWTSRDEGSQRDAVLTRVAEFEQLKSLHLTVNWIGKDELRAISQLRQLESLSIDFPPPITNSTGPANFGVNLDAWEYLQFLRRLKELRLSLPHVNSEVVGALVPLPNLTNLTIHCENLSDEAIEVLGQLPRLRHLSLRAQEWSSGGLDGLAKSPNLISLTLTNPQFKGQGLEHFSSCQSLQKLELLSCPIDPVLGSGLAKIVSLTHLRIVGSPDQRISGDLMQSIGHLQSLTSADFQNFHLCNDDLRPLQRLRRLESLTLAASVPEAEAACLTNDAVAMIAELGSLKSLSISGFAGKIDDEGLLLLQRLNHLESLTLWSNRITDRGLAHLVSLPKLRSLNINSNAMSDSGIELMEQFPNLESLELQSERFSPAGLSKLKELRSQAFERSKRQKVQDSSRSGTESSRSEPVTEGEQIVTARDTETRTRSEWKTIKVTLYRDSKPPLTDVPAKEAVYTYSRTYQPSGSRKYEHSFRVCSFVVPKTNIRWVGVAESLGFGDGLFIECGEAVLYCRLNRGGIDWLPNLADPPRTEDNTLETAIADFEQTDVYAKLEANFFGRVGKAEKRDENSPPRGTNFHSLLGINFWGARGDGFSQEDGDLHLAIANIEKGVVEFDVESRSIKRKAKVWVDLDTRKVVKATLNGKQVFPK